MKPSVFDREVKLKTPEQMFARLQERTAKLNPGGSGVMATGSETSPSEPQPDGAKPSPTPALEWLPKVKGVEAILSACGRYSVSRAAVDGKFGYTAWRRLPTPTPIGEVVYVPDLAKELCEADRAHSDAQP